MNEQNVGFNIINTMKDFGDSVHGFDGESQLFVGVVSDINNKTVTVGIEHPQSTLRVIPQLASELMNRINLTAEAKGANLNRGKWQEHGTGRFSLTRIYYFK